VVALLFLLAVLFPLALFLLEALCFLLGVLFLLALLLTVFFLLELLLTLLFFGALRLVDLRWAAAFLLGEGLLTLRGLFAGLFLAGDCLGEREGLREACLRAGGVRTGAARRPPALMCTSPLRTAEPAAASALRKR
jgi:hypothetical protein